MLFFLLNKGSYNSRCLIYISSFLLLDSVTLSFDWAYDPNFRRVQFPSTLQQIGSEAYVSNHLNTFTLPSQVK